MTPRQMTLVQSSFQKIAPISAAVARLFYDRLFELDPQLRSLFSTDISEQGRKLMQMLAYCVQGLDNLDGLMPAVRALGARHVEYQVADSDYDTVGEALVWTLEKGLGADFTPEMRDAWLTVYSLLADAMRRPLAAE
jgi:hemoglobin-like flavoprotein